MDRFSDLSEITLHLSDAIGLSLFHEDGTKIGSLSDFFIDYEEVYPSVVAIQYKRSGVYFYIPWEDVTSFSFKKIISKYNIKL